MPKLRLTLIKVVLHPENKNGTWTPGDDWFFLTVPIIHLLYDWSLSIHTFLILEFRFADEVEGFKFPGQRNRVEFAARMPRLHSATSVDEWLPRSFKVIIYHELSLGSFEIGLWYLFSFAQYRDIEKLVIVDISNLAHFCMQVTIDICRTTTCQIVF